MAGNKKTDGKESTESSGPKIMVYPWTIDLFMRSWEDRAVVTEKLLENGYPEMKKVKEPEKKTMIAVTHLIDTLDEMQRNHRPAWVWVASNAPKLLQSLATIVPMTMALTLVKSVMTTSNREMVEQFQWSRSGNPFDVDQGLESMERFQKSWLLFWCAADTRAPRIWDYHSHFSDIVNHRIRYGLPTVFTTTYVNDFDRGKALIQLEKCLGATPAVLVRDHCQLVKINLKERKQNDAKELNL